MTATRRRGAIPTVRIGRFLGVPIHVSASWLLFALIVVVLYTRVLRGIEDSWMVSIAFAVGLALLWGLSVLLHELGHVAAATVMRSRVYRVEIGFLGGVTTTSTTDERPSEEFWVSIAGPAVSLLLAAPGVVAAFAGSTLSFGLHGSLGILVGTFTLSNLAVAVFNLLPGLPLDGGRVLVALLWRRKGDQFAAARTAATVGQGIAVALVVLIVALGIIVEVGRRQLPLMIGLVIVALMMWSMARQSRRAADQEQRLARQPIAAHIQMVATVPAGTSVHDALLQCDASHVVMTEGAEPVGMVSLARLRAVPVPARTGMLIDAVTRPIDSGDIIDEKASLHEVLMRFTHTGATEYVVTAADGMVIGVVSVESVTSSG